MELNRGGRAANWKDGLILLVVATLLGFSRDGLIGLDLPMVVSVPAIIIFVGLYIHFSKLNIKNAEIFILIGVGILLAIATTEMSGNGNVWFQS